MKNNVMVGQSGGPTAAINSSLAGVYCAAKECGAKKVYGMLHGIQGLLEGQWIDLSEHIPTDLDVELLKRTPASFLGSCRYKLPEIDEDRSVYEKIFSVLDELEIEVFIYIGGNDSMDTISKLSDYAASIGHSCRFMGCPKTVDNDLPLTDHTPGYGCAAKFIATTMKELIRDCLCQKTDNGMVVVVEIMGRDAGWLTGASVLAQSDDCEGPDLIYLPELPFDLEDFKNRVGQLLEKKSYVMVAVSEGICTEDGKYVCELGDTSDFVDAFGHKQLTGTAVYLANYIGSQFNCKSRGIELSTLQRAASHIASQTDSDEAFMAGREAVKAAEQGETGKMVIFKRISNDPYLCGTDVADIHEIANGVKTVPRKWISEDGTYVTDEFVSYVRPLILGEVQPVMVDGIPRHLLPPDELKTK